MFHWVQKFKIIPLKVFKLYMCSFWRGKKMVSEIKKIVYYIIKNRYYFKDKYLPLEMLYLRPLQYQFSSVVQSCPTICDPMNCSTPVLPVHHHLPEFTQTHVHRVDDAIQPSHPLSSPSPPVPNPSQHQSLFQWFNSSHEVAKVLEFQL